MHEQTIILQMDLIPGYGLELPNVSFSKDSSNLK